MASMGALRAVNWSKLKFVESKFTSDNLCRKFVLFAVEVVALIVVSELSMAQNSNQPAPIIPGEHTEKSNPLSTEATRTSKIKYQALNACESLFNDDTFGVTRMNVRYPSGFSSPSSRIITAVTTDSTTRNIAVAQIREAVLMALNAKTELLSILESFKNHPLATLKELVHALHTFIFWSQTALENSFEPIRGSANEVELAERIRELQQALELTAIAFPSAVYANDPTTENQNTTQLLRELLTIVEDLRTIPGGHGRNLALQILDEFPHYFLSQHEEVTVLTYSLQARLSLIRLPTFSWNKSFSAKWLQELRRIQVIDDPETNFYYLAMSCFLLASRPGPLTPDQLKLLGDMVMLYPPLGPPRRRYSSPGERPALPNGWFYFNFVYDLRSQELHAIHPSAAQRLHDLHFASAPN